MYHSFCGNIRSSKGFTVIELMVVMVIMGVLFVALFPSLKGYLYRGRDTARMSDLKSISSALLTYYSEHENIYPTGGSDCNLSVALQSYIGNVPVDPVDMKNNGCGPNRNYGYGSGSVSGGSYHAVSVVMENPSGGYWNATGSNNPFTGALGASDISNFSLLDKGIGALYILYQ